jgi:hypothetical protein
MQTDDALNSIPVARNSVWTDAARCPCFSRVKPPILCLVETIVNRTGVDFEAFRERCFPVVRTGKYSGQILVPEHSEVAQLSSWHVPG